MLKTKLKLLKYDFKSVRAPFLVLLIITIVASVLGGFFLKAILSMATRSVEGEVENVPLLIFQIIGLTIAFAVICISYFAACVFVWLRYYRHFYTDEGMLTFMLPVKRSTLVNGKIMFGLVSILGAEIVTLGAVGLIAAIGFAGNAEVLEALNEFSDIAFGTISTATGGVVFLQTAMITILSLCYAVVTPYACITVGAILVKKHKILVAVAIYLILNTILGTILSMGTILTTFSSTYAWFEQAAEEGLTSYEGFALLFDRSFMVATIVYTIVAVVSFVLVEVLNKKKLNLAS